MKRLLLIIAVGMVLAFALAAPSLAATPDLSAAHDSVTISDQYTVENGGPFAQSFAVEASGTLASADVYLITSPIDTGSVYAELYDLIGLYGSDSTPTGSAIAVSEPVAANGPTGFTTFTFAGSTPFLTEGEHYALVIRYADAYGGVNVPYGTSDGYSGNTSWSPDPGVWTREAWQTGHDLYFRVWVNGPPTDDVNHAPVIPEAGISAESSLLPVGTPVNLTATFSDQNADDSHTATWQWTQDDPLVASAGEVSGTTVTGSHAYDAPGVYEVTLRVVDTAGAEAVQSFRYVVVYDPGAGFVTGGGWIDSPAGALVSNTTLTGKASFGFISKYQKGAIVPTGNTQFQFKAGGLDFRSTSYDWLVIAGARAQYKGSGTINGEGNYGFMLTAIDGEMNGGGGEDKFRMRIWDKADNDALVYDNQMDAADNAALTTVLGGGSIVIHK